MTKLYLPGEKVPLKIDDMTVSVSQLTMAQKATIIEKLSNSQSALSLVEAAQLAIKYGVKDIQGVELSDGSPFVLEFEDKILADSSVEALLCLPQTDKLQAVCFSLIKGLSDPLLDANGKKIPGVELIKSEKPRKQSKN